MSFSDEDAQDGPARASGALGPRSLEATYRREGPRLAKFLRWRLRGREDEQDILHDAFVRLAAAGGGAALRNPEAYLQRIVHNLLLDRAKRASHRAVHLPIDSEMDLPVPPDQAYAIEADDVKRQYRAAVDALPRRTREVFRMHRIEELRYDDIAERLGISVGTVRWHISQAILLIGKALDQ